MGSCVKKEKDVIICFLQRHKHKGTERFKLKEWENVYLINPIQNKAGTTILGSDKIDFKARSIRRDKKESNKKTKKGQSQKHNAKCVCI